MRFSILLAVLVLAGCPRPAQVEPVIPEPTAPVEQSKTDRNLTLSPHYHYTDQQMEMVMSIMRLNNEAAELTTDYRELGPKLDRLDEMEPGELEALQASLDSIKLNADRLCAAYDAIYESEEFRELQRGLNEFRLSPEISNL